MRRYAIFFITVPVAALFVRLGFWQLSRLHERRATNLQVRSAMARPSVDVTHDTTDLPAYQPVHARGVFDHDRQVVIDEVGFDGMPAVVVVTPLRFADGSAVLVERGWVPSPDAHSVLLDSLREPDSVTVEGVVVDPGPDVAAPAGAAEERWPRHIQRASPRVIAGLYPYRLRHYVLRRHVPPPAGSRRSGFKGVPLPELNDGPHVSYAIQWFSFAIIAVAGSIVLFRKEKREP